MGIPKQEIKNMVLIGLYLLAIIAANLSTAHFGPAVTVVNAFLFIGLDLTTRDALHERWHDNHLKRNMALLIAAGSLLSWFLNRDAGRIALASFAAFTLAAIVDTVIYSLLHGRDRLVRMNGSNVISAAVDSIVFPALAFGFPLLFGVMLGQFLAKVFGGFLWSVIIHAVTYEWRNQNVTDASV
jgi:glycerol uptake facilitator-like aquaporin